MRMEITVTENVDTINDSLKRFCDHLNGMDGYSATVEKTEYGFVVDATYPQANRISDRIITGKVKGQLKKYDKKVKIKRV